MIIGGVDYSSGFLFGSMGVVRVRWWDRLLGLNCDNCGEPLLKAAHRGLHGDFGPWFYTCMDRAACLKRYKEWLGRYGSEWGKRRAEEKQREARLLVEETKERQQRGLA